MQQQKYRFVGTEMVIGSKKLTKLGQEIMLSPEQRKDAGERAPLVHDSLFAPVGLTEQELSLYMYPGQRKEMPKAFEDKLRALWALVGKEPVAEKAKAEVTK